MRYVNWMNNSSPSHETHFENHPSWLPLPSSLVVDGQIGVLPAGIVVGTVTRASGVGTVGVQFNDLGSRRLVAERQRLPTPIAAVLWIPSAFISMASQNEK